MSLKAFHRLFIIASVLLSTFMAAWGVQQYTVERDLVHLATVLIGLSGTAVLGLYLSTFRRKARGL